MAVSKRMPHIVVPEAEALLDREFRVLDRGFVRLVDYMGGDARIVQAARVSYGAGTRTVREDSALIDYLMRHRHTSPFEHVIFEFHCKMPIFVARQWVRHRTARLNEISGRYSVLREEFYLPPPDQIRRQSTENKQGRDEAAVPPDLQQRVLELLRADQERAYTSYEELLGNDIARELARINLPLSLYTEWYWQMDLHNLFHFLALRLHPHAQWEIREYARVIADIVKVVCPAAWDAFDRHILRGCQLSADELAALREMLAGRPNPLTGRRRAEFLRKVFGDVPPEEPAVAVAKTSAEGPAPPPAEGASEAAGPSDTAESTDAAAETAGATPELTAAGFRVRMNREEINRLPMRHFTGAIHAVGDEATAREAIAALRHERILGFDTESRPAFRRGESYPVSIIQFATHDAAYIFPVKRLGAAREELWSLFSDPDIVKVGVAVAQDLAKLKNIAPFEPAGFVDLAEVAARLGIRNNGLRGLCAIVLGFRISKGAQRSNWARENLAPAQLLYAATDAWAGREIYLELVRRGLLPAEDD